MAEQPRATEQDLDNGYYSLIVDANGKLFVQNTYEYSGEITDAETARQAGILLLAWAAWKKERDFLAEKERERKRATQARTRELYLKPRRKP